MDRWWWTNIECGKKQRASPGKKGISYSCIVITLTVIHLRPTPRGRAHVTTPQPWNLRCFHIRQDGCQSPIRFPCLAFPLSPSLFIFNRLWCCVTLFASHLLMDLSHLGLLYSCATNHQNKTVSTISWEYFQICRMVSKLDDKSNKLHSTELLFEEIFTYVFFQDDGIRLRFQTSL